MGLFDFFKQNGKAVMHDEPATMVQEIPKNIFIEEAEHVEVDSNKVNGIESVYTFLLEDFEVRGYNDALTNPDDSYKLDNLKLLAQDLDILIQKVETFYQDRMKVLNFHIGSRSRAGLVDLVEELKTHKEMLIDHMNKLEVIKQANNNKSGATQRIALSYQRGFMRGLSTITQSKIFNL